MSRLTFFAGKARLLGASSLVVDESAKPSKLLVSGKSDLAGDVTAQFEPAEPYAFIN